MGAARFDRLIASFVTSRRSGMLSLLAALLLVGLLACDLDGPDTAAKKRRKKKKCAKAGQATGKKKRKTCCSGLTKDAVGRCAMPGCTPASCPPTACGGVADGCGGTLTCSCQANQLCLDGVCQPCSVTCTGTFTQCGNALQAALQGGGTVYVCPGRYVGNFTITTPARVIGAGEGDDPDSNTILDVGGAGRVLVINSGVGLIELERLHFTDSNAAQAGGGIEHGGAALRMTACTVSGNTSVGPGGGIAALGTLEMTKCTVRDNHALGLTSQGGGIYATGTTTLTDCLIEGNEADGEGGGLFVTVARTTLLGTTLVRGNTAELGGGISVYAGTLVIAETCRVTENTASVNNGGGIRNDLGAALLQGANPSPIVVNNCHENCVGLIPKCAATPVSCP